MQVAIRVDASPQLGTGHVARCAALALALRGRGAQVRFLCRSIPAALADALRAAGSEVVLLADSAVDGWQADVRGTRAALQGLRPDLLVVDHYHLDARWERELAASVGRLLVIDDLADRPHHCDLLLDQNPGREADDAYTALVPQGCRLLLGPRYSLLRDEFAVARQRSRARDGRVARLIIAMGGIDQPGDTARVLQAAAAALPAVRIDVVVGAANPHRAALESACAAQRDAHLHVQPPDLAALLDAADLAIGAGGVSALERCVVGLPTLLLTQASNQQPGSLALARAGAVLHLGSADGLDVGRLTATLRLLDASPELVVHLGAMARRVTDGAGTRRVAEVLLPPRLELRRAAALDCDDVWRWRNDPETRRYAWDPREIDLSAHRRWYADALQDASRVLLIGSDEHGAVGVVRYDLRADQALISVFLAPTRRGQGLGAHLIHAGTAWARAELRDTRRLVAEIDPRNEGSIRAFTTAGFTHHQSVFGLDIRGER